MKPIPGPDRATILQDLLQAAPAYQLVRSWHAEAENVDVTWQTPEGSQLARWTAPSGAGDGTVVVRLAPEEWPSILGDPAAVVPLLVGSGLCVRGPLRSALTTPWALAACAEVVSLRLGLEPPPRLGPPRLDSVDAPHGFPHTLDGSLAHQMLIAAAVLAALDGERRDSLLSALWDSRDWPARRRLRALARLMIGLADLAVGNSTAEQREGV